MVTGRVVALAEAIGMESTEPVQRRPRAQIRLGHGDDVDLGPVSGSDGGIVEQDGSSG